MIEFEDRLIAILQQDSYILSVLQTVEKLQLNDCWIAAGLIRSKVWDTLYDCHTKINDIDVIYFDQTDLSEDTEKKLKAKLERWMPKQPWSVKNQARMHLKNNNLPYTSSFDGVSHFPETPTAVAAQMDHHEIKIMAPYGLEDLFQGIVKPTPYYVNGTELHSVYRERMRSKDWEANWKNLSIAY
ncbi:nucleotidyltransferase family protein [Oceanobacillus jeddahense]|uniref:Nucleotidyltransferase family protein n=1 Tax=Oceanobacillus jeddahense TaxID=1462527 RepID=A0ABY5JX00_9BACI|nr:nucleotidyltransferase family protein [Oceanobacillus jeddahense]UUI03581.1 nucleotidyltransferase family protein [Oceanobacillus jeddahense]